MKSLKFTISLIVAALLASSCVFAKETTITADSVASLCLGLVVGLEDKQLSNCFS